MFFSYSKKDERWLKRLQTVLEPLVRNDTISVWWDGEIKPSQNWCEEIEKALASAKIGVLLVSPDFLASNFIKNQELPYLLEAAKKQRVNLIWILIRASLFKETPLVDYQAAHDISKFLKSLSVARRDTILVNICETIRDIAIQ